MRFVRPYHMQPGSGYGCPAVFDVHGRLVAMGSAEMCLAVVEGRLGMVERQGTLWEESDSAS